MNEKQYAEVVEYFKDLSPFDDENEQQEDAEAGAAAIDEILKDNADE